MASPGGCKVPLAKCCFPYMRQTQASQVLLPLSSADWSLTSSPWPALGIPLVCMELQWVLNSNLPCTRFGWNPPSALPWQGLEVCWHLPHLAWGSDRAGASCLASHGTLSAWLPSILPHGLSMYCCLPTFCRAWPDWLQFASYRTVTSNTTCITSYGAQPQAQGHHLLCLICGLG